MAGEPTHVDITVPDVLAPHVPVDPRGLHDLARFFDLKGHPRLARYLRSCGDHMAMATTPPVTTAVLMAEAYHAPDKAPVRVCLGGDQDQVHAIRLGEFYALVPIHRPVPQEASDAPAT